jgi:hypothetical protein
MKGRFDKELEKDSILDPRRSQVEKKLHTSANIKKILVSKKPFPKIGIFLIIFAISGIVIVDNLPWYTFNGSLCKIEDNKVVGIEKMELYFYSNMRTNVYHHSAEWFFKGPYAYIKGISTRDLFESPRLAFYGLISLIILGIAICIFGILDKKRNFSIIKFRKIHLILSILIFLPCVFIITSVTRFISSYLLAGHNVGYGADISKYFPSFESVPSSSTPVPYILVISCLIIIIVALTLIESDYRIIRKETNDLKKNEYQKFNNHFSKQIIDN